MRTTLCRTLVAAFAIVAITPAPASARHRSTVAEFLQSDSARDNPSGFDHRWYDYDIFTELMLTFEFEIETLEDYDGPLTLFAPKDYAFYRLAKQAGAPKLTEQKTFSWLLNHVGAGPIEDTLLMHIVYESISHDDLLHMDGAGIPTTGGDVVVDVRKNRRVKLIDLDRNDRNADVIKPEFGGALANGYIHGISEVLRPFDLP